MAFFALFSIAPLFVLLVSFLDKLFGEGIGRIETYQAVVQTLGPESAEAVRALILQPTIVEGSAWMMVGNVFLTGIGATALFRHMQKSLMILWVDAEAEVQPVVRGYLKGYIRSFFAMGAVAVVVVAGFFALALAFLIGPAIKQALFGGQLPALWSLFSTWFVSLGVLALFGVLYWALAPEAPSSRRVRVALGTLLAGLLVGRLVVGSLAHSKSIFSLFGAGSAVVYLLLWCFLLSQLFLAGAVVAAVATEEKD